jgi:hypothetical protein
MEPNEIEQLIERKIKEAQQAKDRERLDRETRFWLTYGPVIPFVFLAILLGVCLGECHYKP